MKRNATIIVLSAAAILLIAIIFFQDRQEVGSEPGMMAENFTLPMHNQETGELNDYIGDVIILNTWASWCEPCRDEMPDLMRLQEDYETEGLTILTVNMQKLERTLTDAPLFIDELNINLPVFFDENGTVYERYNIIGLPTTYIIARDGTIEHLIRGEVDYEGLESLIEPLL
ncbi:TlpA family protein disulfide reductase [Alkalihalobacillus deserti]|uniref:TlpA family protein disulfide reductase n=1 Tax=Alkalihalobacillus deserti TaxID=2879466 RepID=UPI001D138DD5|nr:TlpA disulfide reductase family protein [Alkalihalobacillus deserti]